MKKVLLSVAAVAVLSLVACKKEVKDVAGGALENVTEATQDAASTVKDAAEEAVENVQEAIVDVDVPSFSNPEATKFVGEYGVFVKERAEAVKSGDQTKIKELVAKAQEWAAKSQDILAKLSPEDQKLLTDYLEKISASVSNIAPAK